MKNVKNESWLGWEIIQPAQLKSLIAGDGGGTSGSSGVPPKNPPLPPVEGD